ncbi:MAG: hypothetical protein OEY22_01185 [Candidatus Bathyarchaeota archaeon]|nr:hypothetical protein [Candidatus Bathyarchaeota archaeon]
MPERTIRRVLFTSYPNGYLIVDRETWLNYSMTGEEYEYIRCLVSQLLDEKGNILCIVNQSLNFKTGVSTYVPTVYRMFLDFILEYNIKDGMFVDLLLTDVIRRGGESTPISPKRLSVAEMEIKPKDSRGVSVPSIGLLVSTEFSDEYYSNLTMEINKAYGYGIYTGTWVLLRKLFENLIIDLLSVRYGMAEIELFFDKNKGYHLNLSTLISNLKLKTSDFNMFTKGFDEDFFKFLENLRGKAGASAHSLEIIPNPKLFETWKDSINQYSQLMLYVIQKVKDANKLAK